MPSTTSTATTLLCLPTHNCRATRRAMPRADNAVSLSSPLSTPGRGAGRNANIRSRSSRPMQLVDTLSMERSLRSGGARASKSAPASVPALSHCGAPLLALLPSGKAVRLNVAQFCRNGLAPIAGRIWPNRGAEFALKSTDILARSAHNDAIQLRTDHRRQPNMGRFRPRLRRSSA